MKIAFVSDDHTTISAHFGRAQYYEVFTIESGKVVEHQTMQKSNIQLVNLGEKQEATGVHQHQHDHNAMIAPIEDCEVLLTRGMGNGAYLSLQEHDIQPIITDIIEIQTALEAYFAGTILNHPERLH